MNEVLTGTHRAHRHEQNPEAPLEPGEFVLAMDCKVDVAKVWESAVKFFQAEHAHKLVMSLSAMRK